MYLPVKKGGLGFQNVREAALAGYAAASFAFMAAEQELEFDWESAIKNLELLPTVTALRGSMLSNSQGVLALDALRGHTGPITAAALADFESMTTQKWWMEHITAATYRELHADLSVRDAIRLSCLSNSSSGDWMVSSSQRGKFLSNLECVALMHQRMGQVLIPQSCAGQPCRDCNEPVDIF